MLNEHHPVIGQWYIHRDKREMFRIVAVDARGGAVEVQTFDGDVEDIKAEVWNALTIDPIDAPEDWTGPSDSVERDALGFTEYDWRSSLEALRAV